MNQTTIIIKPVITELAINEASLGKYTFAVMPHATKTEIRQAIANVFNVSPVSIETRIMKGKTKRAGVKRTLVEKSMWKKATITLKKGEKISLFEPGGMSEEEEEKPKKGKKKA